MFTKQQVKRILASSTLVAGVSFGASAALAQEPVSAGCTVGCDYYGFGAEEITSSGTWDLGYPSPQRPDIEATETALSWITGPGLGASGFGFGYNLSLTAGVGESVTESGDFVLGGTTGATTLNVKYTYEETARMNLTGAYYYSFAQRWHPYFEAGAYYALGSEASMEGTASGTCNGTLDQTETGTTLGFVYGAGMLVNVTNKVALLASYRIQDNLDFSFDVSCGGTESELASLDSKLTSYGLSLVFQL